MDPVLTHAQVQMWSAKAGMSKSRTALIETIVEKQEIKLMLYFSTGKIKALQLNNNIKSVVLSTYGEDQNYVQLTFKNSDFLFVEKLSTTDARHLKKFLDRVYQKGLRASKKNDEERSGDSSTNTSTNTIPQEQELSSSLEAHSEASSTCLESAKESEASVPSELPFSSSPTILSSVGSSGQQLVKRKRSSHDLGKKEKENILKDNSKEFEATSVAPVCVNEEKGMDLTEAEQSELGLGFSTETKYPEETDLDIREFQDLITKLFSPFLLEPYSIETHTEWHEYVKILLMYPEKTWQGLPNVGNTCYINVVLQSLCSVPLFINDLFNQGFPCIKPPRDDFNMHLMQLLVLKDIYNAKTREKLLKCITKSLLQFGEIFTAGEQNDAHEFLSFCLVQLKEAVQKLTILWQSENQAGVTSLLRQMFADHAIINKIPVCPVANNFEFELMRSIFCKACGLAIFRKEQSSYLSINIPQGMKGQNLSIQSSFDLFFKAEELEHRCERCTHNKSIALHKFDRLPRVIIIHLKRYTFTESREMKKDEQHIIISKYLKLSYHCSKSTKPPQPLSQNAHIKDLDLLKPLYDFSSEVLRLPFNSMMASRFKNYPTVNIRSKESEAQDVEKVSRVLSGKVQQQDKGKGATPHVTKSELTNEAEKLNNPEKAYILDKLDPGSVSKATKHSDLTIPERSPKYQQAQRYYEERSYKKTFKEAVTQRHPKPSSQKHKENPRTAAESRTQYGTLNLQGSLGSSKNSGCKSVFDKKAKRTSKVQSIRQEENAYRLINIISHIGSSPHEGHYINDTFDFRKRHWFTYSDPQVTSIQEEFVQKARISSGYVFFYMHNEIFEELMARGPQP